MRSQNHCEVGKTRRRLHEEGHAIEGFALNLRGARSRCFLLNTLHTAVSVSLITNNPVNAILVTSPISNLAPTNRFDMDVKVILMLNDSRQLTETSRLHEAITERE